MEPLTALILFGLITLMAVGTEIMFTYATQGFGFGFSANRPVIEKTGLARRIERAYVNQAESASYIVPILGAAAIMGLNSAGVTLAAALIVLGRAGFIATYYTGIPFIRVPFFVLGTFGSLYIVYALLTHSPV